MRSSTSSGPSIDSVRENRRDDGNAVRRLQPAVAEGGEIIVVVAELVLPDPDPVEARRPVGAQIVPEARRRVEISLSESVTAGRGIFASRRRGKGGFVNCFATR